MSDNLLPCLKVRDWEGREHTTCRVLWPDKPSQFMPWLAFGWDHPHTFEFLNEEKLKSLGMTEAQVETQALANLRKRTSAWQSHDAPLGDGKTLKLLVCIDDFFAAERILDADFMKEAQRKLGAEAILVGVPRRGVILATPLQTDTAVVLGFGGVVFGQFSRGESAPVSPMLFVMIDGAIVGFEESIAATLVAKKAEEGEADDEDEDGEDDAEAPYINAMTVKNAEGKLEVHLMGGGEDGDRLARGFEDAFHQMVRKYKDNPDFSHRIKIVVFGYTPAAAQEPLPKMVEHLRGIVSDMQGHGMPPITIEMEIQKDSAFGSAGTATKKAPASPSPARPSPAVSKAGPATARPLPPRPAAKRPAPPPPPEESNSGVWVKRAGWLLVGAIVLFRLIRILLAP
jgi:Protein of unknown function (DUF1444)